MATIKEAYCSYEVSKLLKEKGFDEPCYMAYVPTNRKHMMRNDAGHSNSMHPDDYYAAPTQQMAMKWLREKYNIVIVVTSSMFWGKYNVSIYKKGNDYPYGFDGGDLVPSYERAVEAAIKYCLENLI